MSKRTLGFTLGGFAFVALAAVLNRIGPGGEFGTTAIADIAEAFIILVAGIIILRTAVSFEQGEPLRLRWMLAAIGVLSFAGGDLVWTWYEVGAPFVSSMGDGVAIADIALGEVAYPGVPDLFYLLEYVFLGGAIVMVGASYKGLVRMRGPAITALVVGAVATAGLWAMLVIPKLLVDGGIDSASTALDVFYPTADVLLLFMPTVFVIGVIRQLGAGRLGWPWWAIAVGTAVLAFSDSGYSYLNATEAYTAGAFVDYGWMLAHVFMGIGALIARDMSAPIPARAKA